MSGKATLTAKQQDFVRFVADSGSGTYNNVMQSMIRAGYTPTHAQHYNTKIMEISGVKQAIAEYKAGMSNKHEITREKNEQRLLDCYDMAVEMRNPTAARGAVHELNDMRGFLQEKAPNEEAEAQRRARITSEDKHLAEIAANQRVIRLSGGLEDNEAKTG